MAKLLSALLFLLSTTITTTTSTSFTLINNCPYTVWPGVLSNAGTPPLPSTGFALNPTETRTLDAPLSWAGRLWARTLCSTDPSGRFSCATADCGSGAVECSGSGAAPPATLAEFTLNGNAGLDFYDVSLVDGYNLPMLVVPEGGAGGGCGATGCVADLNVICPPELRVAGGGGVVACKSACEAFGSAEYCCSGAFASPTTCAPSSYSQLLKNACPRAYSYAYDDLTSTFTCAAAASYLVTFCPSTTSLKSAGGGNQNLQQGSKVPLMNDTMAFLAGQDQVTSHATPHASSMLTPLLISIIFGSLFGLTFEVPSPCMQICSLGKQETVDLRSSPSRRNLYVLERKQDADC